MRVRCRASSTAYTSHFLYGVGIRRRPRMEERKSLNATFAQRCAAALFPYRTPPRAERKKSDLNRVPGSRDIRSSSLAAAFGTPRRTRACEISSCSSSASANRAAPLAAEVPSMLRRSALLGEQHAGALHGARPGAHRLRASCAKVTPAARRHRDMRRERRVASVRTLALIRVASLVARAASKHSLESSGARRRKGPVHKYWRPTGLMLL